MNKMIRPSEATDRRASSNAAVRAPQGAFGLFAAGGRADHPAAGQAGGRQRLSGAGPDRHQQPVRRAGVLRQAGWRRCAADRRLQLADRLRRSHAGQRHAARRRQPAALAAGRRGGSAGGRPARLPEPDEARLLCLLRSGRGRAAASGDRAAGGARRGPDRADRRTRRPDRSGAARGPEGCGARAPQDAGEDLRRPPVRRIAAPRPEARGGDRAGPARARLCARAPDRRHQRGLLRLARRLRGARRAAVHRRGPLRRRGRPAPAVARALLQDRRADGHAVRRPAGGARQHGRDRPALRLPPDGPQADPAALRRRRRGRERGTSCSSWRRPSCASRPRPAWSGGSPRRRRHRASRSRTTASGSTSRST